MPAGVAENLNEKIRRAVDDERLSREAGRAVHPTSHLDDAADAIERPDFGAKCTEQVERREARGSVSLLLRDLRTHLSRHQRLALSDRTLTGKKDEVARPYRTDV